jgi:hypothetical protein
MSLRSGSDFCKPSTISHTIQDTLRDFNFHFSESKTGLEVYIDFDLDLSKSTTSFQAHIE